MNEEKKSGLHPLAWVGIGCAALLVLGGIATVVVIGVVGHKVKQEINKFETKPALTTAEWLARVNPDIELASSDETAETVTFRNVKTGQLTTVSFKDLEEGRVSFSSDEGGDVTVEWQGTDDGGGVKVTSPEGEMVIGTTEVGELPSWVPRYEGAELAGALRSSSAQGQFGSFSLKTDAAVDKVLDFYQQNLRDSGFDVERTDQTFGDTRMGSVSGRHSDGRFVSVTLTHQQDRTEGAIQYGQEIAGNGA